MSRSRIRFGAVALALALFPLFLPRRARVARRILVRADRTHIFPLVNDLRNWPRWTAWNRLQEIEYHYTGPLSGIGATQHWRAGGHSGVLHLTQSHDPIRIAFTLTLDDHWLIEGAMSLEEIAPHQTSLLWIAHWQGARCPWSRYLDLLMKIMLARDFSAGLKNLRGLAETTAPVAGPEA